MRKPIAALAAACVLVFSSLLTASTASAQLAEPGWIEGLQNLKRFIYPGLTRAHAQDVAAGSAQPFVYASVGGGELPVAHYHYRVPWHRVHSLSAAIPLPEGFRLAPVSVLRWTRPQLYISLRVYEVSGERGGLRAEWTTYVTKDGDETPRVMVLETQTSEQSIDPVNLVSEPAEVFEYARTDDTLHTDIVSGDSSFSATLHLPERPFWWLADVEWNAASDVTYWSNGVADLQYVNGILANRPVSVQWGWRTNVRNDTRWADFTRHRPQWVVLFDERIDTAIRPWVNAADPDLALDPAFRDELVATKAQVFAANEFQRAADIAVGAAEPMADFLVEQTPPSVYLNYEIDPDQREALAAAIPLPEGFEFAPLRTLKRSPKRYYLSLNIYETQGLAAGLRAEWSVYVTREGDPVPRYMIIEAQSSTSSLDPVDVFTDPADVFEYGIENGTVSVDVQMGDTTSFQATIPIPEHPRRRATTLAWTEANNLIYWRNGVADKIYYSGLVYAPQVLEVPVETVETTDGTAWAPYLRLDHVVVYDNRLEFIASPWNNLDELAEEVAPEAP